MIPAVIRATKRDGPTLLRERGISPLAGTPKPLTYTAVPVRSGPFTSPTAAPSPSPTPAPTALAASIVVLSPHEPLAGSAGAATVVNAGTRLRLAGWSATAGDEATMDRALAWHWNCTNASASTSTGGAGAALMVDGRAALVTGRFLSWDLPSMTAGRSAGSPATTYVFTLVVNGPAAQAREKASPRIGRSPHSTGAHQCAAAHGVGGGRQVIVRVNAPPWGGNFSAQPLTGRALVTNFTLRCEAWCVV
jgi:hypothetical protein